MAHEHREARDRHGNPKHMQAYLRRLLSPDRDVWQMPDRVVRALGLKKGHTVAEIGAGPGYFTLRLARAVGRNGAVLAVEVEPKIITVLRERLQEQHIDWVSPILGAGEAPWLPPGSSDLVLAVNVAHHVHDLPSYLRRLKRALKPRGRIVNVDFHKRELPVGPPVEHTLSREQFLGAAKRAGLRLRDEKTFLPHQYFLVLTA